MAGAPTGRIVRPRGSGYKTTEFRFRYKSSSAAKASGPAAHVQGDPTVVTRIILAGTLALFCGIMGHAEAQTAPRGQATSPGQSRATNRLPQPPSGGVATGQPASGPETDQQRQADMQAKRATEICKGC